jgi:fucose permease
VSRRAKAATLILASAGFVSLGLPEGLLGVAWPSIRASYGLGLDALGPLLAAVAAGSILASTVSGRLMTRFGLGRMLAVNCGITGSSLLGYALAPTWTTIVMLGVVLGAAASMIDAALNVYAATEHGPRVMNWMHAAFGLGAAIGPLLMTAVLSGGFHWSIGYFGVGIAQVCLGIGYAVLRTRFGSSAAQAKHQPRPEGRRWLIGNPTVWLSLAVFLVYAGLEVATGQWTYSLFTEGRSIAPELAGVWVSGFWTGLMLGRVAFGVIAHHVSIDTLLRSCMLVGIVATALIWWNVHQVVSLVALAVVGLVLAPIFPSLMTTTPERVGDSHTPDLVGWQVGAAVVGIASIPSLVGVLAARFGIETIGPCLLANACALFVLHEALIRLRPASEPQRSAISRTGAAASPPQGA